MQTRTKGRITNPAKWFSGPDPILHDWYNKWLKHRCQCVFRKEAYELSWEDFKSVWFPTDGSEPWKSRGRSVDSLCLIRKDTALPWRRDNVEIVTRFKQLSLKRKAKGDTDA